MISHIRRRCKRIIFFEKSKKTQLTSEQEKEEELFKTYGLLNNTLWMLVMGNTRAHHY